MTKTYLPLSIVAFALSISGCASVQDANYQLYVKRVQAQSYLLGKQLTLLPHPNRVRRVSNNQPHYCPASNNCVNRQVVKSKQVVNRAQTARVHSVATTTYRRPAPKVLMGKAYRAPAKRVVRKPVYRARPVVRQARPVVRRSPQRVVQRPVQQRRVVQKTAPVQRTIAARRVPVSQLNDALFSAAKSGNIGHMTQLISQGAQVNASNGSGESALHAAASQGRSAAVSILLQKGANPNAKTTGGWTPLHTAARFRHAQVVRLLVSRGGQVNARNSQGKTPLALAELMGATSTATVLRQLGGR